MDPSHQATETAIRDPNSPDAGEGHPSTPDAGKGHPSTPDDDDERVWELLERTLAYAREREYTGWDYGDGMSSRLRRALPVEHKWLNIGFQELAKRVPVNVRPLLLVEQRRNYKGTALFAMANQTIDQIGPPASSGVHSANGAGEVDFDREAETDYGEVDYGRGAEIDHGREARSLLEWLVDNRSEGYSGYCGAYQHPIQHLDGRGDPGEPDVVNTSFGVKALLRGATYDSSYPDLARTAASFVLEDLQFRPVASGTGAVIDYHTKHPQDYYTINAGALGARLFVDLYAHFGEPDLLARATALLDHIAELQTDLGGWYYRDPPTASHLSMDSHHNGFVIECFQRYRAVSGADRYDDTLEAAMEFYREVLFEDDGAPNFDETSPYPRDIHASTQGAIVFTYAGEREFARQILEWVFENLYAGDGRFYYRKERYFTRRVTLMRWCQAWMAYAMTEYLAGETDLAETRVA